MVHIKTVHSCGSSCTRFFLSFSVVFVFKFTPCYNDNDDGDLYRASMFNNNNDNLVIIMIVVVAIIIIIIIVIIIMVMMKICQI